MNRNKKTVHPRKKLVVNKQTLRELTHVELERPAGGEQFDVPISVVSDAVCEC